MFCACTETTGQVLAEAALRESEARASGGLEGMAEGFVLVDRDFRVLAINAEGMKLESRSRDEIIGRTHWEAWPETAESELGRLYRRAVADRVPVSLEHCYVWPDGRQAWIEMRCYPSGDGLAMFYRDISDRNISEPNQTFHFDPGERLRRLTNPVAVTSTAAECLGRHLRVARAGCGEIDEAQEMVAVARDWTQAPMPSLAGKARLLDGFGPALAAELKAGRTLVVEDFRGDPRAVTPTPKPGIQSARRHSSSCRWCAAGACARSSTCMSRNRGPGRRTMSNSPGPRPSGPWRRSSAPVRRQPCWRARHSSRRSPIRSSRWSGRPCPTASTTTTISVGTITPACPRAPPTARPRMACSTPTTRSGRGHAGATVWRPASPTRSNIVCGIAPADTAGSSAARNRCATRTAASPAGTAPARTSTS